MQDRNIRRLGPGAVDEHASLINLEEMGGEESDLDPTVTYHGTEDQVGPGHSGEHEEKVWDR